MEKKYVYESNEGIRYKFPTHTNLLLVDRADSTTSEVFLVEIDPRKAPPLHQHNDTEQVFYILQGRGQLQIGRENPLKFDVRPSNIVRIPPGTPHLVMCTSEDMLRYLCVDCFIDGRPSKEPTWESHVRTICKENAWDFQRVKNP